MGYFFRSKKRFGRFTALFVRKFTPEKENSRLLVIEMIGARPKASQTVQEWYRTTADRTYCKFYKTLDLLNSMILQSQPPREESDQLT